MKIFEERYKTYGTRIETASLVERRVFNPEFQVQNPSNQQLKVVNYSVFYTSNLQC